MERESLLTLLIVFLGGVTLQLFAALPWRDRSDDASRRLERQRWLALWGPTVPTTVVAAWLCGWALSQPDPVHDTVSPVLFFACAPFVALLLRGVGRAVWSLALSPGDCGVATVGILRPHIMFSPQLAKRLDDRAIEAALAHERAHVRHHDPLRIWVAQFVMDLQWPWRSAPRRFAAWLAALEEARDDEARAAGVDGADLAAALVGALRLQSSKRCISDVGLIGQPEVVQARIARLLRPLPDAALSGEASRVGITTALLVISSIMAFVLGLVCGESVIRPLLRL